MDIAEHMDLHDSAIRGWLGQQGIRGEFWHDAYQNIRLAMIEAHERGSYDHGAELLTYLYPYLRGIAFRGYVSEHRYGGKEELDQLQEMAEKAHGRYGKGGEAGERIHLDRLYDESIEGLKTPLESSLTPEEEEETRKLLANLTDEDREILQLSYDHSERQAAEILGIPKSTYHDRLERARERAAVLLKMF